MKKETRLADFVMGGLFMALAVVWFVQANQMMKVERGIGPGEYPKIIAIGLFIVGFLQIAMNISGIKGLRGLKIKVVDWKGLRRLAVYVAVTFVYVRLMNYLGFILLTPLYIFFACWFFGYRKHIINIIVSITTTAVIHLVFRVIFMVVLPEFRLF